MFGRDMLTTPEAQLRQLRGKRVGVIVQNARSHLNPLISIGDQISNVYRAHEKVSRREAQEKAIEMLQNVGMPAPVQRYSAYPHELSGGMAQRAMIAMALICSPELLIADEPTSGLDVTIQDQILKLFRRSVAEQGAAGLLVSRDMGIVANFCDRVAVMFEGRIVEVSDVPSFFTEARHPHSMALIASASYNSSRPPESTDREEVMA
jgi:ABC-type dipeptide/oligopeptide/nickel transport system ATPase component